MQFDSNDGLCKVLHGDGANSISVPYETDRWVKIQTIVDLEDDWTRVYYDDELVTEYTWTGGIIGGGGGALDIAAVDLYANSSTSVYYDNLKLEPITGCGGDLDESDADGDGLVKLLEFLSGTDSCDPDTDGDTVLDGADNCPSTFNPGQADDDEDGLGDSCDPVWNEEFDDYPIGPLVDLGGWLAWEGDPAGANFEVSPAQAHSLPQSLAIDGLDDAVRPYSGYDYGEWVYSAWSYVPPEMDDVQYFVLMNTYPSVDFSSWSLQLEIDGADGLLNDFDSAASLPLIRGEWVEIRVEIDLLHDEQVVTYGGDQLVTKSWTAGNVPGGAPAIAAVDMWGAGSAHTVLYDDLTLAEIERAPCATDGPTATDSWVSRICSRCSPPGACAAAASRTSTTTAWLRSTTCSRFSPRGARARDALVFDVTAFHRSPGRRDRGSFWLSSGRCRFMVSLVVDCSRPRTRHTTGNRSA